MPASTNLVTAFLHFTTFQLIRPKIRTIRLELMDLAFYPGKDGNFFTASYGRAYISIKAGYKYIFSETKTGFYVEPSAGWGRVVDVLPDRMTRFMAMV